MNFDKIPAIWFLLAAAVYGIGFVGSFVLASKGFVTGFAAGGALALLNAWASARKVKKAELPHKSRVMASLLGGFYIRLILLGVCLYGLIRFLQVDPMGLITGLSVIPAGLFVMLIFIYIANRRPEEA